MSSRHRLCYLSLIALVSCPRVSSIRSRLIAFISAVKECVSQPYSCHAVTTGCEELQTFVSNLMSVNPIEMRLLSAFTFLVKSSSKSLSDAHADGTVCFYFVTVLLDTRLDEG